MFRKLEGDTAVLIERGVYKPTDLYEWDGKLFARVGAGYVRLRENGTTTKEGVRLEYLEIEDALYADKFGRLTVAPGEGRRAIARTPEGQLQIEG